MLKKDVVSKFIPLNLVGSEALPEVIKAIRMQTVAKGTIIFKRGKLLTEYHYLLDGEINLIDSDFGVEKVVCDTERACHSLNLHTPTAVSAIAKTKVTYLAVDSGYLDRVIANSQVSISSSSDFGDESTVDMGMQVGEIAESSDWMSCLLQSPLFSRLPMTQLQELFGKFEKVFVRKGERVVREGAAGDYFYVIASGQAVVTSRSGNIEVTLKEGDYFGEEALISDAPRNASVTMMTDGMLKCLNADDFAALVKEPVLTYVSWKEVSQSQAKFKIVDVRLPVEFRSGHLPGSVNLPLSKLRSQVGELSRDNTYLLTADGGARADIAAYILCKAGFDAHVLSSSDQLATQSMSNAS